MFVTGSKIELIQRFKDEMKKIFEMTDLGVMKYFLGMEVLRSSDRIFICQQKYISDILNRFKMQDYKPMSTLISTGVKLGKDADFEKVDDSSCILQETHFTMAKRVLRYIKGTNKFGIFFPTSAEVTMNLIGYSDSEWVGGVDDSRTTSDIFSVWGQVVLVRALENKKLQLNQQQKLST
ncbi:uncharacterized mitochondrial protein AtMg00810-like [Solanum stenotomum]|uniref:uncharacterized mitochondrial protein AtMg00810-like n=1 Tax=Solanum stenotomum TaxID=172797 RepID=UPI0020D1C6B2|nr:uncharacterized mitochondrial protein AtMg00810-like [Solanum stenotomum]